jgi:membrane-bound lytic murein transglycosylase B
MAMRPFLRTSAALLAAWLALPAGAQLALTQPLVPEQFAACVQGLASQASLSGRPLSRDDFVRIASAGKYDDRVRQSMLIQTSEPTFWWDDLAATTDEDRVRDGQAILARAGDTLQRIEAQFGVPKEIVVAIYGIETNYGPSGGKIPVLDAALSYACLRPCPATATAVGSCQSRERAFAAVRLLRDGRVKPDSWQGSWAAAFGRTQFVPDSFEQLGVDFDGDGIADIINSEADAWATTANHLRTRGGWTLGVPVYIEVSVPPDQRASFAPTGRSIRLPDQAKPLSQWVAQGWGVLAPPAASGYLRVQGDPLVYPFLPVGLPGPAFLVSKNFDTVMRYNRSDRYVMEVSLLANKLAGGRDFVTAWPTDDPGLSRAQVRELQAWLLQKGYTQVVPDGVMGRNTRDAIEKERALKGLPPGRRVGQRTMALLMQS